MSQRQDQPGSTLGHPTREVSRADEGRLTDAMKEYLEALEAGRPLDREAILRRHPEIAQELAASLEGIDFMHHVAPQLAPPEGQRTSPSAADLPPPVALGDFRIVRQIGKGGMGVVYEAVQLSLGRRMALKVLPFAAVLDPKQLQRFKNEAQAAASLDHPNIVGVHSVGCERGVHYYAMQYVEGQTLAEVIRQLRGARDQGSGVRDQGSGVRGEGRGPRGQFINHQSSIINPSPSPSHPLTPSAFPRPPSPFR